MSSIAHVCRNCGGAFGFPLSEATFPCPACGALHARPKSEGESLTWLRRANEERAACEFAHAEATYRQVLGRHPEEHEALWGLVMCKYGVELVEGKPTIHFHRRKDIITDPDFVRACALAGEEVARQYRDQAEYISAIQRSIPAGDEKPFDVFLCYRAGGAQQGQFAREYYHAYELYLELQKQGYRVFFAHVTLRDQAGASYEARIFHALYSAPAMLVVCSDAENLLSPWVHSEWSRYLERVNAGEGCRLIPMLYDGCNPYALPHELQMLQCVTVGQADWWGQLQENLQKVIRREQGGTSDKSDETGKRLLAIEYALSGGSWNEAAQAAEALRKAQPDCAKAYLYKLLAKMRLAEPDGLAECETAFEDDPDWKWALRLASPAEKTAWTGFLAASQELRRQRAEERRRAEEERRRAEEERRAREAEERRRAEEERRRAEEERRAREAREAEERRREEQARRTRELAERQQRIKTQEEETWRLLEAGKWDEAAAAADRIPSSDRGDKALLMLLAKHHLPSMAALAGSGKACSDPLFDKAVRTVMDEERREQLQKIDQEARQRREKKEARTEFLGRLFPALGAVLLMLASALLLSGILLNS